MRMPFFRTGAPVLSPDTDGNLTQIVYVLWNCEECPPNTMTRITAAKTAPSTITPIRNFISNSHVIVVPLAASSFRLYRILLRKSDALGYK